MYAEREWRRDAPATTATAVCEAGPAEGERRSAVGESVVYDFASVAAKADNAEEIRRALAGAVHWAAGDAPASLTSDEDGPTLGGFAIPVRAEGGRDWGWIELGRSGDDAPARNATALRRLETVAILAALALDRLDRKARTSRPCDADDGEQAPAVHDATLLSAVLPFAIGQARRHQEPLSILFIAIDQLRGLRDLLGVGEADRVVARVGARISGLLRSSDLVGRLDDDRLMAILPRAELADALRVGAKLSRKLAGESGLSGLPIGVTISVGAAETPTSATTLGGLLDAADTALSKARRRA